MKYIMTDLEEYKNSVLRHITYGEFILHSGQHSTWIFDAIPLLSDFIDFMVYLDPKFTTMGIEFCGSLLAIAKDGGRAGIIRKDGKIYEPPSYKICWKRDNRRIVTLVDDVVTTEGSFLSSTRSLAAANIQVGEYIALLDRRPDEERTLDIRSIVSYKDLGLSIR